MAFRLMLPTHTTLSKPGGIARKGPLSNLTKAKDVTMVALARAKGKFRAVSADDGVERISAVSGATDHRKNHSAVVRRS